MARYFSKEEFKTELDLDRIDQILERLYSEEDMKPEHECSIEVFMMSDTLDKLDEIEEVLEEMGYDIDSSEQHSDGCELIAITPPIKMNSTSVKNWYNDLWKKGFEFDCKLDGWHVLID